MYKRQIVGENLIVGPAEHEFGPQIEQALELGVDELVAADGVLDHEHGDRIVHDRQQLFLVGAQAALGFDQHGVVEQSDDGAAQLLIVAEVGGDAQDEMAAVSGDFPHRTLLA